MGTNEKASDETGTEEVTEETGAEETGTEEEAKEEVADPKRLSTDLAKAIKRRDAALRQLRQLKEENDRLKIGKEEETKPDAVALANGQLVKAEARTQLAALGITDRAAQRDVLDILNLDGVEVDDTGEVDSDAVEDRISRLAEVFGALKAKEEEPKRRPAPRTSTKDRGAKTNETSDPDAARYQRILGRRG